MNFQQARVQMVEAQLRARGISDERVLAAMAKVPRHLFVEATLQGRAYEDAPLPIDAAQTISQPYMVALMTQLLELRGAECVLEVGTGSGYQAAILAELARAVCSVERIAQLADEAGARLARLGYQERVRVRVGDGGAGWPEAAPFEAIVVTAAVQQVPRPLVLPLGEAELQGLARIRKQAGCLRMDYFGECRFVKLIGCYGWEE